MVNQQNRFLTMKRIKKSIALFYFDKWTILVIRLSYHDQPVNLDFWNEPGARDRCFTNVLFLYSSFATFHMTPTVVPICDSPTVVPNPSY